MSDGPIREVCAEPPQPGAPQSAKSPAAPEERLSPVIEAFTLPEHGDVRAESQTNELAQPRDASTTEEADFSSFGDLSAGLPQPLAPFSESLFCHVAEVADSNAELRAPEPGPERKGDSEVEPQLFPAVSRADAGLNVEALASSEHITSSVHKSQPLPDPFLGTPTTINRSTKPETPASAALERLPNGGRVDGVTEGVGDSFHDEFANTENRADPLNVSALPSCEPAEALEAQSSAAVADILVGRFSQSCAEQTPQRSATAVGAGEGAGADVRDASSSSPAEDAIAVLTETPSQDHALDNGTGPAQAPVTSPLLNEPVSDKSQETDLGSVQGASEESEEEPNGEEQKAVPRYQPPRQKPPTAAGSRRFKQEPQHAARPEETLAIHVHLTFDRFHFCTVTLLPERIADLDEDIEARDGKAIVQLVAQEDWYEDLEFDDLGTRLRCGVELKTVLLGKRPARWLLTGREIYVLATHPRAHAYVSTNRLALGRSDVVLCTTEIIPEVEALLVAAGCRGYVKFDESQGAPQGWVGFRELVPSVPIPLEPGIDPFYPLKPAPDIEIGLEGGVCLRNSAYLAGYPPQIKLYGQHVGGIRVFIDGMEARLTPEGMLEAEGSTTPGPHNVLCEGLSCSRSYSIEEPPESWEPWAAYSFREAEICGPLVQPKARSAQEHLFSVPMSNPLLIGSVPGQVFRCSRRKAAVWKGFVPFDVVWALPEQPLTCDKRTARIIGFRNMLPALPKPRQQRTNAEVRWSTSVLDAGRKGLRIEGASGDAAACWRQYKLTAQNIRRGRR